MPDLPHRYRSPDEDSGRWLDFVWRDDDIVISTRSKSGTTWVQMICALLVLGSADLPAPLSRLSPWLDWLATPKAEVLELLANQQHRRFIKTHTPLDGLPVHVGATYLVVGRHPLDSAVSLYHQAGNINRRRLAELTGTPVRERPARPPVQEWLRSWIEDTPDPRDELDSLPGVMWHLTDAWERLGDGNVVLLHYDDLRRDLPGQMRALASRLEIDVPEGVWPRLVEAASFDAMRARADLVVPDPSGVLTSHRAFFRQGISGSGRALLTEEDLARYHARVAELAPPALLSWLHREPAAP